MTSKHAPYHVTFWTGSSGLCYGWRYLQKSYKSWTTRHLSEVLMQKSGNLKSQMRQHDWTSKSLNSNRSEYTSSGCKDTHHYMGNQKEIIWDFLKTAKYKVLWADRWKSLLLQLHHHFRDQPDHSDILMTLLCMIPPWVMELIYMEGGFLQGRFEIGEEYDIKVPDGIKTGIQKIWY